jgi:hypothetical protein
MGRYNLSEQFEDHLLQRADFEGMANREEAYVQERKDELEAMEDAKGNDGVPGPRDYEGREDRYDR